MDKNFLSVFAGEFMDTDKDDITMDTVFHELDEWSSFVALSIQVAINDNYGKLITMNEMRGCKTVSDLYNLVCLK